VLEERLFRYEEVRKEKTYSTSRRAVYINIELEESTLRPDQFWSKLRHDMLVLRRRAAAGVVGPILDTISATPSPCCCLARRPLRLSRAEGLLERIEKRCAPSRRPPR